MTIEEILAGESKNVEFKENLPEKKHQIYEICGCLCKWNRRKNHFRNCR